MPTRPRQVRPNPQCQPVDTRKSRCQTGFRQVRLSPPTQHLDTRTQRCQPAPRQVRPNPPTQPRAVGVAGARPARWGGLVLRGGTTPVAFPRGRACFWAPALRFCVGCCRGPAQNKFAPSSCTHCRGSGAEVAARRRGRPPEPKAEAPKFLPRTPNPAYAKINLIESPQIHSLPTRTDKPGATTSALWTTRTVVDKHNQHNKIICHKSPRFTAYRAAPTNQEQRAGPVDTRARCG
ncbi:hypothetical protein LV75_002529 [Actinokineospora diospyrosa]|uniref:Uncharacterized protein n=1 Tax=Actinokineospora diospyrosa TaxID=103728 RepID=A0ABT1IBL8_9PSEU|nr:hypothetical protein [Actinokineospora diospyrosa]